MMDEVLFLPEMHAHLGKCLKCDGPVKMGRDERTYRLKPDNCWCLFCGQLYWMDIKDIKSWESQQWNQKYEQEK